MLDFLDNFIFRNRRLMRILVPIFCMWINFVSFSYIRGSGVLYMEFIKSYGATYAQASWTFTLATSLLGYSTCLGSFLLHYLPVRSVVLAGILLTSTSYLLSSFATTMNQLIILAAIQGTGIGFFIFISPLIIMEYLNKAKSFGCGIAICGCNMASLFFPSFIQFLLNKIPMKDVFLIMACFAYSALIPGLFLAKPKKSLKIVNDDEKDSDAFLEENKANQKDIKIIPLDSKTITEKKNFFGHIVEDFSIFKNPYYYLILFVEIIFFFCFLSFMIIMQNLPVDHGIEKTDAASLSSFFAIGEFFGSLLPGLATYYQLISNKNIYVFSMILMGVQYILIPMLCKSYLDFIISYTLIGASFGCQLTLPIVILTEYLGFDKAPMAKGFSSVISSSFSLLKPLYIDYVKTKTGSYDSILYINGIMCFICTIPWLLEIPVKKLFRRKLVVT